MVMRTQCFSRAVKYNAGNEATLKQHFVILSVHDASNNAFVSGLINPATTQPHAKQITVHALFVVCSFIVRFSMALDDVFCVRVELWPFLWAALQLAIKGVARFALHV